MDPKEVAKLLKILGLEPDRKSWYKKLGYIPRRGQKALDDAIDGGKRYASLFAFPRAGKSYGAAKHVGPYLMKPDCHGWIVAPKYEFGAKEFGYLWHDLHQTGLLRFATKKYHDPRGGNMFVEFPWGAFVQVISADNPVSLRAEELDWIILAEASAIPSSPETNIFDQHLFARVEKRQGIVLVPTTPKGKNWIYDRFRLPSCPWDRAGLPNKSYDDEMWSCVLTADPTLLDELDPDLADLYEPGIYDPKTVAKAKLIMPTPIFIEQFGGGFASYAGRILPYDPDTMRVPADTIIPSSWTHIVGWDHGASPDPTAIVLASYSPDGTLYCWGEIESKGNTTLAHLGMLEKLLDRDGKKEITALAVDPSAKQVKLELASQGVNSESPLDKQVLSGIMRLTALMQEGKFKIVDGACQRLERELARWEWDEKNPQKPAKNQADHFIDAIRYASLIMVPLPDFGPVNLEAREHPAVAQRKARVWKNLEDRLRLDKEAREADTFISEVEEDPFEEVGIGIEPEEYDHDSR